MKYFYKKIKDFFTYNKLTLLPLMLFTLVLFILNKILHVEWYISVIATLICAFVIPKIISSNWDSKLLKFSLFQKYLNFMLMFESVFLSSFITRFTTGVYIFIIFEVLHQSNDLLISFIFFFLLFLFLLYFRLRSQIFSINELAYDFINEISPEQLNNHFLKMLGVQLNLKFKHNFCLMGFPKRGMHSTLHAIKSIGRTSVAPLVGAGISYTAYTSDQAAAQRNKLAETQISRLCRKHENLKNAYYEQIAVAGSLDTPEHQNIRRLMDESASNLERLGNYAHQRNTVGIRIFTKPIPTDSYFNSLQTDTMESLAKLSSKINSAHTGIQKTGFYELSELIAKSIFV